MNDTNQPANGRSPEQRLPASSGPIKGRGQHQPPAILTAPPRPLTLVRCLRRRLVLALGLGILIGAISASGVWVGAPQPDHTVVTRLRVPPGSAYLVRTSEPTPDLNSHQRNQAALVKSRLVLKTALADPKVDKAKLPLLASDLDPVAWLEKKVQVDFATAPEIMQISMSGQDTETLEVLVNAIREAYLTEVVDHDRTARKQRSDFLEELIGRFETRLKSAREEQNKVGGEEAGGKNEKTRALVFTFNQQALMRDEAELLKTQSELREAKLSLKALEAKLKQAESAKIPEAEVTAFLHKEREVQQIQAEISRLQSRIEATIRRSASGERDPAVTRDQKEVSRLKQGIEKLRPQIEQEYRERVARDAQSAIVQQQVRISNLESNEKLLGEQVKLQRDWLVKHGESGGKLVDMQDRVLHLEKLLQRFREEQEALRVELEAPTRIKLLQEATTIRVDGTKRKLMMAAGAALAGLGFVVLAVSWLEYRTRRIDTVDEVVLGLGFRLVGTVPSAPQKARAQVGASARQGDVVQQVLLESVDATRTTLLHVARVQGVRTVMVASAVAGEGKTSLTCHLAASMARGGLRTLLIDGDGRKPRVHKLFRLQQTPGFGEVLCGECAPAEAVFPTSVKGLSVMPAGTWSDEALLALNQGRAAAVFDQLRQEFDLILVDSSPVLPVADALNLGQQVDGVLLSVLSGVSRLNNVYVASQRIEELGIKILGVVVSGVQVGLYSSAYSYPYPRRKQAASATPNEGATE